MTSSGGYITKFMPSGSGITSSVIFESGGFIGVATTSPSSALEVNGQVKITGGTPGLNKVLTSDATGLASWTTALTSLS